jgi:hypothetical protein
VQRRPVRLLDENPKTERQRHLFKECVQCASSFHASKNACNVPHLSMRLLDVNPKTR